MVPSNVSAISQVTRSEEISTRTVLPGVEVRRRRPRVPSNWADRRVVESSSASVAGESEVVAVFSNPNWQGSARGIFKVEKAVQKISCPVDGDFRFTSEPLFIPLLGASDSGLPSQYRVVEGQAAVHGNVLEVNSPGMNRIGIIQAGDAYQAPIEQECDVLIQGAKVAEVEIGNLIQTYDGTPRQVSARTVPDGLNVVITYESSLEAIF